MNETCAQSKPSSQIKDVRTAPVCYVGEFTVWLVSITEIMSFDSDWGYGKGKVVAAHHWYKEYVPPDEIWIGDGIEERERVFYIIHELYEAILMRDFKLPYEQAHARATTIEEYIRGVIAEPYVEADTKETDIFSLVGGKLKLEAQAIKLGTVGKKPHGTELRRFEKRYYTILENLLRSARKRTVRALRRRFQAADELDEILEEGFLTEEEYAILTDWLKDNFKFVLLMGKDFAETVVDDKADGLPVEMMTDEITKQQVSIIKSVEKSEHENLRQLMNKMTKEGADYMTMKEAIEYRFDIAENRAKMIAVTESQRAHATGWSSAMKKMGYTTKIFRANPDEKTCQRCDSLDGGEFGIDDNAIPVHPYCRCWYEMPEGET